MKNKPIVSSCNWSGSTQGSRFGFADSAGC